MILRTELRAGSARYLNSLSADELFNRFGITRVGDVTGLDSIGIPVLTTCRPAAKIVSVNAGKSLDRSQARAGAIAEAIECSLFDSPPAPKCWGRIPDLGFPLAAGSSWTPEVPVALQKVTHLESGETVLLPSSLVWLVRPEGEPPYFQKSSNGQATGGSLEDALLQGIYECVERDQYVLRRCSLKNLGLWPPRCVFVHPATEALKRAGLKLFLFRCTLDLGIPVYWAFIVDLAWRNTGGWGAHLNPRVAAERAVLEAIQSRGVVISGARDDLDRRDPDWQQALSVTRELEALPIVQEVKDEPLELSAPEELELVKKRLGAWKERIYFYHIDLDPIHVVKVQILGFEQPVMRHWKALRWPSLSERYLPVQASIELIAGFFPVSSS